jgi:hypothetical protein
MKSLSLFLILIIAYNLRAQDQYKNFIRAIPGSDNSIHRRLELSSDIDSTWGRWKERGYNFGFNPAVTPMYTNVNGILSTPYMLQVRGNENERKYKRWGYHVFEGYAKDDKSRITMLVNKHIESAIPVAELYYYSTVYDHSENAKLTNALTLGNIGQSDLLEQKPDGDAEVNAELDAKFVNYKELKGSGNGTMFYDKDNNIVVIKVGDKWMKVVVAELPENIKYPE